MKKNTQPPDMAALEAHVAAIRAVLLAVGFVEHVPPNHCGGFAVTREIPGVAVGEISHDGTVWTNPSRYRAAIEQAGYTVTPMPINDAAGRYSHSLWYVAPK